MAKSMALLHQLHQTRSFVDAKIKWVRDPYLDAVVLREKDLKQSLSLLHQILSSTSKSLPLSSLSPLKSPLSLPTTASKFFMKFSSLFSLFQPSPSFPLHVKLAPQALCLHREELAIHNSPFHRRQAVERLAKLLMLAKAARLPLHIVDRFKFDLGLPHNYVTSLLSDYPDYFHVCCVEDRLDGKEALALELVCWRKELAVSQMEKRGSNGELGVRKGMPTRFSMKLPRGFDLKKKVMKWVEEWQNLPYISPYENAFHLSPSNDQAEKWAVAVLHELLWILVSKKTERENVLVLGDYLGFGSRFKKALVHHPGIFYVSNKIRTQTVVLREAFRKDFLVEKHPLMGMRHRYIHLMNKANKRRKPVVVSTFGKDKRREALSASRGRKETRMLREDEKNRHETK